MVVTFASLASAQSARQAPHDFASAMAIYNQSSLPTQKTVSGVFAGTCYWSPAEEAILKSYPQYPNPAGAWLRGGMTPNGFRVVLLADKNYPAPAYYENEENYQQRQDEMENIFSNKYELNAVTDEADSLIEAFDSTEQHFRSNGDNIISIVLPFEGNPLHDTQAVCYWFKRLK